MNTGVTVVGLVRDVVAAALALAILFDLNISNDQVAGVLLLVTTLGAFGSWAYGAWQAKKASSTTTTPSR